MTESEAKTKTCHKTLVPIEMPGGGIGPYFVQAPKPCIGSACMAWRRLSGPGVEYHTFTPREHYMGRDYGGELVVNVMGDDAPEEGYCGLAGAQTKTSGIAGKP